MTIPHIQEIQQCMTLMVTLHCSTAESNQVSLIKYNFEVLILPPEIYIFLIITFL